MPFFRPLSALFFLLISLSSAVGSARACDEDLALLHGDPNFQQLASRALGLSGSDRLTGMASGSPQLKLTGNDIENLFADAQDPWMQRMSRYLLKGMGSDDITVRLKGDPKDTGYAAGTCWSAGIGRHAIDILLTPSLMGGNPHRNGIRAAVRSTLIHEAMHARIKDYQIKWLEQQALDPSVWHRRLDTATEEFMARMADQRAIGRTGVNGATRAWFDTLIGGRQLANPWATLETAWTQKLKAAGIKLEDKPQRLKELAQQSVLKEESLLRQRGWMERSLRNQTPFVELRAELIRRGKITPAQWDKFEAALVEEFHPQWGSYNEAMLAKAAEAHALTILGVTVKGDYGYNAIYRFKIGEP